MYSLGGLAVYLLGKTDDFEVKFAHANRTLESFGGRAQNLGARIAATGRMMSTGFAIASGLSLSYLVHSYAEHEKAEIRLIHQLRGSKDQIEQTYSSYKKLAGAVEDQTAYSGGYVKSLISQALQMGVNQKMAGQLAVATIGLSEKSGRAAPAAMRMLIAAQNGVFYGFRRLGIQLTNGMTQQEKYNKILKFSMSGFDLARSSANTLSGRYEQLSGRLSNLRGEFVRLLISGLGLDKILKFMADAIKRLNDGISKLPIFWKKTIALLVLFPVVAAPVLASIGFLVSGIGRVASALVMLNAAGKTGFLLRFGSILMTSLPVVFAFIAAIGGIGLAIVSIFGEGDTLAQKFESIWVKIKYGWAFLVGFLKGYVLTAWDSFNKRILVSFQTLTHGTIKSWTDILAAMKGLPPYLMIQVKYALKGMWLFWSAAFENMFTSIFTLKQNIGIFFGWLQSNWRGIWANIAGYTKTAIGNMGSNLRSWFEDIIRFWKDPFQQGFSFRPIKDLTDGFKPIKLDPIQWAKGDYRDVVEELTNLWKQKQKELDALFTRTRPNGITKALDKAEQQARGIQRIFERPSRFSEAAQRGSAEAYRIIIGPNEDKLAASSELTADNTGKSAESLSQLLTLMRDQETPVEVTF